VQNVTQNTDESSRLNSANPGDSLKYRIYFRNTGTGQIDDLKIDDTAPAFTSIQTTPAPSCDVIPTGMSCAPVITGQAVKWVFTGSLPGGASGEVSYQVKIDQ
jgi:uncharacterized repeat protein (TIGR01451 family)